MNYLLNLSLPLYFMLLPLGIAVYLANKYYKWKAKYYKAQFTAETNALQLIRDFERHKAENGELQNRIETLRIECENYISLNRINKDQINKDSEIIRNLNTQSVEREALIENLDKKVLELTDSLTLSNKLVKLGDAIEKQLLDKVQRIESKLQLSELAHNETKADIEGLEVQFKDALSVINRTGRAKKQWDKICKEKAIKFLNTTIEAVKQKQSETVVHDILGVARVFEADQSQSVNNRHTVVNICNEVNRGIAEQTERIRQELEVVDMSTLESGDSVKLRNNETVKVLSIKQVEILGTKKWLLGFGINKGQEYYNENGVWGTKGKVWEWDVIQIIKPAKFEPQVDEIVRLADFQQESFKILEIRDDMYFVEHTSKGWKQYRSLGKLLPIAQHEYKNSFIQK